DRQLEHHMRPPMRNAGDVTRVDAARFVGAHADIDNHAFGAQFLVPLPRHFRIWVFQRRNNARDAGTDNCVSTRWRFALMRAWLKRHIHGGALRRFFGTAQCLDFSMRSAAPLGPAATDNDAVLDDQRADRGVRPGVTKIAPPERKCELHVALGVRDRLKNGGGVFVHFRALAAGRPSSSPDNSSSAARKSLASRKLR